MYDGDFKGATLTDANFTDANVEEVTFENTNIESATWVGTVQQESSHSPDNGKTERTSSATEPETDNREEESDDIVSIPVFGETIRESNYLNSLYIWGFHHCLSFGEVRKIFLELTGD